MTQPDGAYWEQGQHISALGKNGAGKTTTLVQVCDMRRHAIALLTKRHDPLFSHLRSRGYTMLDENDEWLDRDWAPKIAIHLPPDGLTRQAAARQAAQIRDVLHRAWSDGNWTLYIDEIAELSDLLNLKTELRALWKEARSSNVSLVAGTQRPAWVPREMYSQSRFLLFWKTTDWNDLKAYAEMNAVDPEPARAIIPQLDRYEMLAVDTQTEELVRTRPPKLQ